MTQLVIDDALVRRMVAAQFPNWANLPVRPLAAGGWDNRTFHIGQNLIARLPSAQPYVAQVEKEHRWLPWLAPLLPLPIPKPVALGEPTDGYPWHWSIYQWIEGATAGRERIGDLSDFAAGLARFLLAMQRIDPVGPPYGAHNFYRGGPLRTYDAQTRQAVALLKGRLDVVAAARVWETALATTWSRPPVWVHGDISADNLLVQHGRLSAVIDFGMLGVGDPACDLSIAWTLFEGESRAVFRDMLALDSGTWARGRAWALWKALIVMSGLADTNAAEAAQTERVIEECLRGEAGFPPARE